MAEWIKGVLISLISVCIAWSSVATAATAAELPSDVQAYRNETATELAIIPKLTNSAEIPVVEVQIEQDSLLSWMDGTFTTELSVEADQPSKHIESKATAAAIEQWLSLIQTFFVDN